ncbi:Vitamin B12 import ATP-binding protein BtuD [Sinobacterium norvegicum]|uniref:Vitamin B12 import ATP-binding protein BtuD n=1 Tax=Sinobacterium norvegicum TaxID=1641715 RepID=A0ABM9AFX5_9GAMM|nr:ABC transporter ATP-binding protein [Sinobacterium norvegicum]CAH0992019.1 Vitamin B12 import ATP-binding protein BtuD [Sinobacterium norvegicum]
MILLNVEGLGKAFRKYGSELHRFASWFGIPIKAKEEKWVLKNISFKICKGEAIGIIGQNGAGKSTLLKMITGTLQPTKGKVRVNGRIAAILELGMGFNPELTGRQNVRHSAGLMGFNSQQIDRAMASMEEFAEIGEYFDQPVRTYSSGMRVRVAFAVATAYRPEILIVDEALSVGDEYFKHKSFNRIREFQEQGTTLLIVSHDRGAIQSLCNRAILLEDGHIIKDGNPEAVFDFYNAIIAEKENSTVETKTLSNGKTQTSSGTGEAKVSKISLLNHMQEEVESVSVGDDVNLKITVKAHADIPTLILGYSIKDRLGQTIYGTNTALKNQPLLNISSGEVITYNIRFPINLGIGSYSIQTALVSSESHLENNYEWLDLAYLFNVININKEEFAGCAWIDPIIETNRK